MEDIPTFSVIIVLSYIVPMTVFYTLAISVGTAGIFGSFFGLIIGHYILKSIAIALGAGPDDEDED